MMELNICYGCMTGHPTTPCSVCGYHHQQSEQAGFNLTPGTVLNNGAYLVGNPLGQGGFGITYLGWDTRLDIKLAVKEFYPQASGGRMADGVTVAPFSGEKGEDFQYGLDKFLDEAKTVARFQGHPCIVSVLSFFEENGTGYMVMPYIEGMTLIQYLKQQPEGRLPFGQALNILMPIMDALREVHSTGVLHRDISPDNIYITTGRQIKLLDFGAARSAMGEHNQSVTSLVKPGYSPQEQYRTQGNFGAYSDIYALAATFFRSITGEIPFSATDRMMGEAVIWPSERGIELPAHAEEALIKALQIKEEDRFQRVADFQQALHQAPDDVVKEQIPQIAQEERNKPAEKAVPAKVPKFVYIPDPNQKPVIHGFGKHLLITLTFSLLLFLYIVANDINNSGGWIYGYVFLSLVVAAIIPVQIGVYYSAKVDFANYKKLPKWQALVIIILSSILSYSVTKEVILEIRPDRDQLMAWRLTCLFLFSSLLSYLLYAFFLKRQLIRAARSQQ